MKRLIIFALILFFMMTGFFFIFEMKNIVGDIPDTPLNDDPPLESWPYDSTNYTMEEEEEEENGFATDNEVYEDDVRYTEPGTPTGETTIRWVYEKSDLYGGFEGRNDAAMTPEELHNTFKDVTFELFQDLIFFGRDNGTYLQKEAWEMSGYFYGKLREDETPEQIRHWFKETFDIQLGDSIHEWDILYNPRPYHRILVFPDKILMCEYGAFYASFIPVVQEEKTWCRWYHAGMETLSTCRHPEKTIPEVYRTLQSSNQQYMKEHLPTEDIQYTAEEEVGVRYTWISRDTLEVELWFPGGVTTHTLIQGDNYTQLIDHYSAD